MLSEVLDAISLLPNEIKKDKNGDGIADRGLLDTDGDGIPDKKV
jgi:hypothetical protein